MATAGAQRRLDERLISAGTTARFALLMILLLLTSSSMMISISFTSLSTEDSNWFGCYLAAGADPNQIDNMASSIGALLHEDALDACLARYAPNSGSPWQLNLVWPGLTLVASAVVFRVLPTWKARRGRRVPLETIDRTGVIRRALDDVAAQAGLARTPRFVFDPTTTSASAVVFGSNRRPTVCLHAGLLVRRTSDPEGFRAVLLHEFAHVRNGDVTLTYATVALWRVFLALVLLPYLVWCATALATSFQSPIRHAEQMTVARAFILPAFLTALLYLARADVLRMREVYADLTAVRWGANPRGWAVSPPSAPQNWLRHRWTSFAEVWRTHPQWDLRRGALADPALLFGIQALPMFLAGVAAAMITDQTSTLVGGAGGWRAYLMPLLSAMAVTGVAGIALWRAVAHAVLTQRRVPSGARAGLWLGTGMAVGAWAMGGVSLTRWFPPHVEVLGGFIAAGTLFAWWTTQCSHLWFRAWPRRAKGPAMLLVMAAGCLMLTAWFAWWKVSGTGLAGGWFDMTAARHETELTFPGPTAAHQGMVSAISVWFEVFSGLTQPVVLAAVCALWVVPLLGWTTGPTTDPYHRTSQAPGNSAETEPLAAMPPLRRMLLAAMLGGVACWIGVAIAKAYMHTWQPPPGQRDGLYAVSLEAWVFVALVTVSVTAGVVASAQVRPYPLLTTLIVAEVSTLTGLFGCFMLVSVDGCIQPISTFASSCHWVPFGGWAIVQILLAPVLVSTALLAAIAAAIVLAIHRMRGVDQRHAVPVQPPENPRKRNAQRVAVAVICAVALTSTAMTAVGRHGSSANGRENRNRSYSQTPRAAGSTAVIRRAQLEYWLKFGGSDLWGRFADSHDHLGKALNQAEDTGGKIEASEFGPVCREFDQIVNDAGHYFPIPDAQADSLWQKHNALMQVGGRDCLRSLDQGDVNLFNKSIGELADTIALVDAMGERFDAIRQAAPAGSIRSGK